MFKYLQEKCRKIGLDIQSYCQNKLINYEIEHDIGYHGTLPSGSECHDYSIGHDSYGYDGGHGHDGDGAH